MSTSFGRRLPRLAICLLATLTMVLGLVPGAGVKAALADELVAYPLWVGEAQVTSENLEGKGWVFDPESNALKLENFSYSGAGHSQVVWEDVESSPIFWADEDSTLIIVLEGESSVTVTGENSDSDCYAVFSAGNLAFKGEGGLIANAGDVERGEAGIYAAGDIAIETEGASISARGQINGIESFEGAITVGEGAGSITAEATDIDNDGFAGIFAEDGSVRIDGGAITASGYYGIFTGGNIVVNDGEVHAQSALSQPYGGSILEPSGIYCVDGTVTVSGGTVYATGHHFGIFSSFSGDEGAQGSENAAGSIVVNGGTVFAEAMGIESGDTKNLRDVAGISADKNGVIIVAGGIVQATGGGIGALGINARSGSAQGSVEIGEGIESLVVAGTEGAFGKDVNVRNAVSGIGWTDVDGTEGKTVIEPSADGQALDGFRSAMFPASAASVVTPPSGLSLTYNGEPQELVKAGEAEGGEMQYSLDGKTFDAALPTATDPGDYTVYYKAVGDETHTDSAVETVASTIAQPQPEKDYPAPTMSDSKGGGLASQTDEITYTVSQKVPDWATSVRTWVDLESVLQFTSDANGVTVTCDGATVDSAKTSIEGQRLTVAIDDATALRGKTIQIAYKAKLRQDAKLDPYLNEAKDTASVPYQASTSFDGEDKAVSSEKGYVKFKIGSAAAANSNLAKTGDEAAVAAPVAAALAALAAAAIVLAARRRKRD